MTLIPQILWAQRKDQLFLTVDIQDNKDAKWNLDNDADEKCGIFQFSCIAGENSHQFQVNMKLFGEIKGEEAKISNTPRKIFFLIPKKEVGDHWPRLIKEGKKEPHIKVDWNHYIDQEDEESGAGDVDLSKYDFSNYAGMDEEADSDDEIDEDVNITEAKPETT
eukprot:TRINITY_DN3972_c0_g3_i1.p2 TRINITY_DN3972_c0_g3~~TRINITY_DN3972_c0_g3_i1.p2  ORF type:complete len:164 (-),score=29.04 TRINITY_DN3972_c0_g3_i1:203-694(-)